MFPFSEVREHRVESLRRRIHHDANAEDQENAGADVLGLAHISPANLEISKGREYKAEHVDGECSAARVIVQYEQLEISSVLEGIAHTNGNHRSNQFRKQANPLSMPRTLYIGSNKYPVECLHSKTKVNTYMTAIRSPMFGICMAMMPDSKTRKTLPP
jgi:hypothetical protein